MPVTLAGWFQISAAGQNTVLAVSQGGANNDSFRLRTNGTPSNLEAAVFTSSSNASAVSSINVSTSVWHHGAAVFTSATSRTVYLDGGNTGTNTTSLTPSGIAATGIGAMIKTTPVQFMQGNIGECAVWSVDLTAAEITALAGGISPFLIRPGSLVDYWPVWGLHSPEIDMIGTGRTLTVTGTAQVNHPPVAPFPWLARDFPLIEVAAATAAHRLALLGVGH